MLCVCHVYVLRFTLFQVSSFGALIKRRNSKPLSKHGSFLRFTWKNEDLRYTCTPYYYFRYKGEECINRKFCTCVCAYLSRTYVKLRNISRLTIMGKENFNYMLMRLSFGDVFFYCKCVTL